VGPAEPVPAVTGVEAGAGAAHAVAPPGTGALTDEPPPGITVGREGKQTGRELE
jgi:hypothetical protein